MKRQQPSYSMNNQRGVALIILVMIMIITVTLVMVGKTSRNKERLQSEAEIRKLLADAKEAMISIAVANQTLPGVLFYPDRNNDTNFDGLEDCNGGANPQNTPNLLLGRMPFLGAGTDANCTAPVATSLDIKQSLNVNERPPHLHYVVSQNLVEYSGGGLTNTINANVVNETDGWLTVYDQNGNVIGANVAFIIFYPGHALAGQNRNSPIANAAQFLDSFNVPGVGMVNNANPPAVSPLPSNYVVANESATFNDKLIFVTATELMRRVEQAVLNRITRQLENDFNPTPYPVTQGALTGSAPYNAQPLSNWLLSVGTTGNTYDDNGDSGLNNGYLASVTYSTTPPLTCNGVTYTGAVVRGVAALGNQCAGAN